MGEAQPEEGVSDVLSRIALALAELDLDKIVQTLMGVATSLCRAQFGAFFYNVVDSSGEKYMLYALAGVPRSAFSKFPMPRKTQIFNPTFSGTEIVRSDDVTLDPRYGKNAPYHGMPEGHLPVRSYLAVPVIAHGGEVLGGLFFGHERASVFTAADERLMSGIAVQAAVAIENARLLRKVREERALLQAVIDHMPSGVVIVDAPSGRTILANRNVAPLLGSAVEPSAEIATFARYGALHSDGTAYAADEYPIARSIRGEVITNEEIEIAHGSGERRYLSVSSSPVRDGSGRMLAAVVAFDDITEQKRISTERIERIRQESAARAHLFSLLMQAPVAVAVLRGGDHVFELANARYAALFPGRNLVDRGVREALPELVLGGVVDILDHVYATGERHATSGYPVKVAEADGSLRLRHFDFTVEPLRDDETFAITGLMVVGAEVTEQVQAQTRVATLSEDVRRSEEHYRFLAESMPQIVWTAAPDGTVDYVNRVLAEYIGRTVGQALAHGWDDVVHGEDLDLTRERWARSTETGDPFEVEHRMRGKDGAYRWFLVRGTAMRDPEGRVSKWFGTSTDVDDLKRAEEARAHVADQLRRSEERYRSLVEVTTQIVWTNSPEGEMLGPQPGWNSLTGQTLEEYQKQGWSAAVHVDDRALTVERWKEAVATGDAFLVEHRVRRRDGEYRWFSVRAVPVREADGAVREWVGLHTDITERRRAEAERADLLRQAREAIALRDEFLSIASHELNTPLTPLKLQIAALRDRSAQPEKMARRIDTAERQVDRLTKLVSELLDVSRITAGRLTLRRERLDLRALLEEVLARVTSAAPRAADVRLLRADPVVGDFDPLRIDQVLTNILVNAVKYGAGKPIEVSLARKGEGAEFVVRDHGIGIAETQLSAIFERFERAVSSRNYGGFGLGLWIARQVVDACHGTIRVESTLGEGSVFSVWLPLEPPAGPGD